MLSLPRRSQFVSLCTGECGVHDCIGEPLLVPRIRAYTVHKIIIHVAVNVHPKWTSTDVHAAHSAIHHGQARGRVDECRRHIRCACGGIVIATKEKIKEIEVHAVTRLVVFWSNQQARM